MSAEGASEQTPEKAEGEGLLGNLALYPLLVCRRKGAHWRPPHHPSFQAGDHHSYHPAAVPADGLVSSQDQEPACPRGAGVGGEPGPLTSQGGLPTSNTLLTPRRPSESGSLTLGVP